MSESFIEGTHTGRFSCKAPNKSNEPKTLIPLEMNYTEFEKRYLSMHRDEQQALDKKITSYPINLSRFAVTDFSFSPLVTQPIIIKEVKNGL